MYIETYDKKKAQLGKQSIYPSTLICLNYVLAVCISQPQEVASLFLQSQRLTWTAPIVISSSNGGTLTQSTCFIYCFCDDSNAHLFLSYGYSLHLWKLFVVRISFSDPPGLTEVFHRISSQSTSKLTKIY